MADYGLLSGLAQGLNAGMDAYEKAQDRQQRIKQYQDELEVKKLLRDQQERGMQMEMTSKGLLQKPEGGYAFTPEKQKEMAAELNYKNAQTAGLLATAEKSRAEAEKDRKMILTPEQQKLSGELKAKIGGLTSSLDSIDELENIYKSGEKKGYISSDTPLIGGLISDRPVDKVIRKLADDIGRLRSGGAINADEEGRFMNMLPRAADELPIAMEKIKDLRKEFLTRSGAMGIQDPQAAFSKGGLLQNAQQKQQAQTKVMGGKTFKKVPGGWEEI